MIDTNTDKVTAAIAVGRNPQDITWAPDGRYAYVVNTTRQHGIGDRCARRRR